MKLRFLLALSSLAMSLSSSAVVLTGVTVDNQLVTFDTAAPGTFLSSTPISGLVDPLGSIVNLTFHVGNGKYYGLDNSANFYEVSSDGTATLLNDTFAPTGFSGGLTYDTFTDNLIFGSIDAENFTLTAAGTATQNANFAYALGDTNEGAIPAIFALGFDPITGEAFFLDSETDTLSFSVDPGLSELFTVGSLGIDVTSFGALVVDEDGNLFASLSTDALNSGLYSIDKVTGEATLIGNLPAGVSALAIPEPTTALLAAFGSLALLRRRRA